MGLIVDLLSETQRALVETYSESVYQNLVTELQEERESHSNGECFPPSIEAAEGEVQEYASFRELFTIHVDQRADLDDVPKFTYLLGTLGREPIRIVKSLSVTAANYKIALDLLDRQYGNVHQTLVILHRKLANIFVPSLDPVGSKS
ncbi:uncharacterized protein [Palaemon carinicauda]|uniref:uncharacterized protein n=1 Tax=Palaemon carinicauda TaxID=392227 RepID=UPI0035B59E39